MRRSTPFHALLALAFSTSLTSAAEKVPLPANRQAVLNAITASELKGDLSFLASDLLQGRYTPSPGLEIAAEFIASKFRAAGLEPGGDRDYFQMAPMVDRRMPPAQSELTFQTGGSAQAITVSPDDITLADSSQASKIERAPVLLVAAKDPDKLKDLPLAGYVIVVPQPDFGSLSDTEKSVTFDRMRSFDRAVAASGGVLEVTVSRSKPRPPRPRLIPPDQQQPRVPSVVVVSEQLSKLLDHPSGAAGSTVSFAVPAPVDQKALVKNVIGILRGSDPVLKSTCVLLTAHYDHIGTIQTGASLSQSTTGKDGDSIYNGANDDGSGTVSVIEIARAISRLTPRPKRSIVFMTFFGEERGGLGSQYYGAHPVFPIDKTVADVNLEQVGRTDSTVGKQLNNASLTGFDYSTLTKFFEQAGRATGIKIYRDPEASDAFFTRSDNASMAEQGVPAHTLTVAFDYPDYHALGDEWQKINYANMAKVDRMIALGLLNIADSPVAPVWNARNPKTLPFREAQKKSRPRSQ
ncbi:MAG TPA: M28 family peptidase [Bryobacteraceae bacterium]|nr:M28 family peptidase [Bryobacteraceae bacterium]